MFQIGICEDDLAQQSYLEKCIMKWADLRKQKVLIYKYTSGEQFLFAYEEKSDFDLLVLDIQLEKMNGMELARKIRQANKAVKIVFHTGLTEYAIEGYEVGAVRYLLKPLKQEVLENLLDNLWQEIKKEQEENFLFMQSSQTYRVPYSQIVYVEANGHYLSLMTEEKHYEWKASFSSVTQEFESHDFFLLKRGLYVNLMFVNRITKTDCILESGEQLPVSKNRYKALNEAFIAYYRGRD